MAKQKDTLAGLSALDLLGALRKMYLIRFFEEKAEELYALGKIHGTMHLSIGQEASAVGSCLALRPDDYITERARQGRLSPDDVSGGPSPSVIWACLASSTSPPSSTRRKAASWPSDGSSNRR